MRAIVLGSGLKDFIKYFEILKIVSFDSVLNVSFDHLDGHERKYIWCQFESEVFVVISGKFHHYEGYSYVELISPLKYAVEELGVEQIIVTSASGGLSSKVTVGEWAYLNRLICIPEVKLNFEGNTRLNKKACEGKAGFFSSFAPCTYAYHQGPSLGSLAEYRMLNKLGADLVGMSMLPEYCYLSTLDIGSYFLSVPVCTYYPLVELIEPSFEEVLAVSALAIPTLADIFKSFLIHKKNEACPF